MDGSGIAAALASEFSRVALFNVNGNRLEGRRQTGFDFGSDISKVAVPLATYTPPKKDAKVIQQAEDDDAVAPDATGIGKMRWPARGST